MIGSFLLYAGLVVIVLGTIALVRAPRHLRMPQRGIPATILAIGLGLVVTSMWLPASDRRITAVRTQLDREMPVYQFRERHALRMAAPPKKAYAAIKQVTANEIRFFRTLTWIRRGGRKLDSGILNAPGTRPILDVSLEGGFVTLFEKAGKEIVLGTVVKAPPGTTGELTADVFRRISSPGFVKATINFQVTPADGGTSIVSTETRVFGTDDSATRAFARYWRVIYPGSAIIRRSWLQAIKRRAERKTRTEIEAHLEKREVF